MSHVTDEQVNAYVRAFDRAASEGSTTYKEAVRAGLSTALHTHSLRFAVTPRDPQKVSHAEEALFRDLADCWNKFCALPEEHGSDNREFEHHVHILQRMILARSGRRQLWAIDQERAR